MPFDSTGTGQGKKERLRGVILPPGSTDQRVQETTTTTKPASGRILIKDAEAAAQRPLGFVGRVEDERANMDGQNQNGTEKLHGGQGTLNEGGNWGQGERKRSGWSKRDDHRANAKLSLWWGQLGRLGSVRMNTEVKSECEREREIERER